MGSQLGVLALAACYTSYLTPLPPTSTLSIINNHLLPCITEKGFTIDMSSKLVLGLFQPNLVPSFTSSPRSLSADRSSNSSVSNAEDAPPSNPPPPSPPPPTATPHLLTVPIEEDRPTISNFDELSHCLLTTLSSESLSSHHVYTAINTNQLLQMALIGGAWNRWPLVYDPEGLAVKFIKQCWGKEAEEEKENSKGVVVLDARDRYIMQ